METITVAGTEYLTVKALAEYAHVHLTTAYYWTRASLRIYTTKELGCSQFARILVRRSDVDALLKRKGGRTYARHGQEPRP